MDAKKYNNFKLGIGISKAIISFILLLLFIWLGYSQKLADYISLSFNEKYLVFLVFIFSIGIVSSILFAPVNFYTGFYLEHKYKLSNQTFGKWLWENLKSSLVSLAIGIPILLVFYFTMNQFGDLWWLPFGVVMFFVSVVLT
ncbi:MAG: M48 family peptidase, partial [Ignavibacteriaceae bacterium]